MFVEFEETFPHCKVKYGMCKVKQGKIYQIGTQFQYVYTILLLVISYLQKI